jgi:hypothetical protein
VDETWFVDCDVVTAMHRVFLRQTGNGLSPDVARQRIDTNDFPNAKQILATRSSADLILPALPLCGGAQDP